MTLADERISEAFAHASLYGGLATATCYGLIAFSITLFLSPAGLLSALGAGLFVALIAGLIGMVVVIFALALIALPLTLLLEATRGESIEAYVLYGGGFGLAIPLLLDAALGSAPFTTDLFWLAPAMITGGVAGWAWGRARLAPACLPEHPNRLHDDRILR